MSAALARLDRPAVPQPEGQVLEAREFRRLADMMERETGIAMGEEKTILIRSRLQRRLRELGLPSFRAYCDFVDSPQGRDERTEVVNALTTNLTAFFREPHHFKHLVEDALAPMVSDLRAGGRLRIWSAGSSTGEEAYSIGMMLLSICPEATRLDARILATDVDSAVLRTAHAGLYDETRMKGVPTELRDRFFEADGDRFRVCPELRRLVTCRKLNLNAERWPMGGTFDIVFCRNTVIYFDEARQMRMWERFRDILRPGGHLYLGHSERLSGSAEADFERVGVTIFRNVQGA
ncbi:MAG: protein-glutamate O-methyltransferase [Litorimonas sp.]